MESGKGIGTSPDPLGTHTAEPSALPNQEEPVSTLYQYVPTEPVVLSPHTPVISSQQEIDDLRQYKTLSEERFEKTGRLIADQNKMMEFLMAKLK